MASNTYTKAEMISLLKSAIRLECDKPEEEIDLAYLESCSEFLAELTDAEYTFTAEQLDEKYRAILNTRRTVVEIPVSGKPLRQLKPAHKVIAAAAAALVLAGSVCAFNPYVRNLLFAVNNLEIGETMESDGVTYQYNGVTQFYDSIQELIEKEQLNILYLESLPEGLVIKSIIRADNQIVIQFTDTSISFNIKLNSQFDLISIKELTEEYVAGRIEFFIHRADEERENCTALGMYNGNLYTVETKEYSQLMAILDELGKGTLQ